MARKVAGESSNWALRPKVNVRILLDHLLWDFSSLVVCKIFMVKASWPIDFRLELPANGEERAMGEAWKAEVYFAGASTSWLLSGHMKICWCCSNSKRHCYAQSMKQRHTFGAPDAPILCNWCNVCPQRLPSISIVCLQQIRCLDFWQFEFLNLRKK